MSHKIKVEVSPQINKDLSESKTRKCYKVIDRHRKSRTVIGTAFNQKDRDNLIQARRDTVLMRHLLKHPNDKAFLAKHPDLVGVG